PLLAARIALGDERLVDQIVLMPSGAWGATESDYVMHGGAAAGTRLRCLNPLIFRKARWQHDVGVLNNATLGNIDSLGHRDDLIGLANDPSREKLTRLGSIFRIAFLSAAIHPIRD